MKKKRKEKINGLPFLKLEATGNNFVFIDLRGGGGRRKISGKGRASLVKKICDNHYGIGCDGVVFLENAKASDADIKWDFYNSDGSSAEMCGNAARAVGCLAFEFEGFKDNISLETKAGIITIKRAPNSNYGVTLPSVRYLKGPVLQKIRNKSLMYFLVDSGVPHAVVPLKKELKSTVLAEMAVALKRSGRFGRGGANVTFFWARGGGLGAITHERGVEDFTLSCGTGAVAAAWVAKFILEIKFSGQVQLPGGRVKINFSKTPELVGPANLIAKGTLYV